MSDNKLVLVTGATGKQGGAVARALLDHGHRVRGMTRDVDSEAARALTALGAEMVAGDFADSDSLVTAATGVDAVFAMSTPFEAGIETEVAQGVALIDAAVAAGVDHFVYTSVASADENTGIPHFDSKYEVERYLSASDLAWTVVAPVYFMENLFMPQTMEGLGNGIYATPLPADLVLQQVAVADIGALGAHVVANRDAFTRRRVEIASDELTSTQSAEVLTRVLDRPISTFEVPMDQIREFSEDFALMYEWFISTGYSVDIEELRATNPEVGWHRFADWAEQAVPALV